MNKGRLGPKPFGASRTKTVEQEYAPVPSCVAAVAHSAGGGDVSTKITVEQVQTAVRRYFQVLSEKTPGELADMYTYDSLVFGAFVPRPEPGRVSAARREREYFKLQASYRAEITGPIEVQILGDNVAVASHTMRAYALNLEEPTLGKRFNRTVRDGRGTHVFVLDAEGKLLLAHQHISDICRAPLEPVK